MSKAYKLGRCQVVAVGAGPASTVAPANVGIHAVMLVATADCHVRVGDVTATSQDTLIRAGWPPIVLSISEGDYVTAIQDSAPGNLYVTELTH